MASLASRSRQALALVLLVIAAVSVTSAAAGSKSFTITNECSYTVWPGILSSAGAAGLAADLDSTGFLLAPGESRAMPVPSGWSGRLWGRTLCSTDTGTGKFACATGDCGSGKLECAGGNAAPPVTLAQFMLDDAGGGMDTYYVSLVDGYNLPIIVVPQSSSCAPTGCVADLNVACPAELRVTSLATGAVACKSACLAFGSPQYCCTGEYGNPGTCGPTAYSQFFKSACPRAFSYTYDGATSTFTCAGGDTSTYAITFCPSMTSGKSSTIPNNTQPQETGRLQRIDGGGTTPNTGGGSQVGEPWRIVLAIAVLGLVTAALGVLAKFFGLFKLRCNKPGGQQ